MATTVNDKTVKGNVVIEGTATGQILMTMTAFNAVAAWTKAKNYSSPEYAALDTDWQHPWDGTDLQGRIICFPAEVGSTHSPLPFLDLIKEETGPAGIIVGESDPLLIAGNILSKVWYGPSIPIIEYPTDELMKHFKDGDIVTIGEDGMIHSA